MWQQTQSEKREQLFPPGSAWKKALTPPSREATAKKTEANHLLRMQVGLCVLLVGAVLLLRQLNKPVYEEFRREYAALTQQEGADETQLLQFAGSRRRKNSFRKALRKARPKTVPPVLRIGTAPTLRRYLEKQKRCRRAAARRRFRWSFIPSRR